MMRIVSLFVAVFFLASILVPRAASAQVITGSGEGETTTTTSSDGSDSDDNTLSFVLLGAVIVVLFAVAYKYSKDEDSIVIQEKKSSPVGLYVKDEQVRDIVSDDSEPILTAGLAFNTDF